jgi:myo-inositol 2-dehydrogenase/D-chiro-inositol 1-dehydrogenase
VSEWNYGFPQEMEHFVDCVLNDKQPLVTGEDGKVVMEIIFAAYQSAGTGCRVTFPYTPPAWAQSPIHCWKPWLSPDCPDELRRGSA